VKLPHCTAGYHQHHSATCTGQARSWCHLMQTKPLHSRSENVTTLLQQ
jgi:hypothetical protein